jgi:hypothetical protein
MVVELAPTGNTPTLPGGSLFMWKVHNPQDHPWY